MRHTLRIVISKPDDMSHSKPIIKISAPQLSTNKVSGRRPIPPPTVPGPANKAAGSGVKVGYLGRGLNTRQQRPPKSGAPKGAPNPTLIAPTLKKFLPKPAATIRQPPQVLKAGTRAMTAAVVQPGSVIKPGATSTHNGKGRLGFLFQYLICKVRRCGSVASDKIFI